MESLVWTEICTLSQNASRVVQRAVQSKSAVAEQAAYSAVLSRKTSCGQTIDNNAFDMSWAHFCRQPHAWQVADDRSSGRAGATSTAYRMCAFIDYRSAHCQGIFYEYKAACEITSPAIDHLDYFERFPSAPTIGVRKRLKWLLRSIAVSSSSVWALFPRYPASRIPLSRRLYRFWRKVQKQKRQCHSVNPSDRLLSSLCRSVQFAQKGGC